MKEELQYRFHDIQDRLIELANFGKKQPRLFRFSGKQVATMVDVIRSFPMQQINSLRYAFLGPANASSSPENPQDVDGVHYLYVDKETALTGLDPIVWWSDQLDRPVEFWLDPYWCQHYGAGGQMELFVPHGLHLFPTINAWEPAQMDNVLTQLVHSSMKRAKRSGQISPHSILIIDRDPKHKEHLQLTALDKADFMRLAPPQTDPKKMALAAEQTDQDSEQDFEQDPSGSFEITHLFEWLNSYLYWYELSQITKEVNGLTLTLDNLRKHNTALEIERMADQQIEHLKKVREDLIGTIQTLTTGLGDKIATHLSKIIAETSDAISEARVLNGRLGQIQSVYEDMLEQTESTVEHVERTDHVGQELHAKLAQHITSINKAIQDAAQERDKIQAKLTGAITKVQATRNTLNRKISADLDPLNHLLKQTKAANDAVHKPRFSAYFPAEITPTQWYAFYIYAYLADAAKDVHADATDHLPVKQPILQSASPAATTIPIGKQLMVTPRVPGIEFNPPTLTLGFYESWHRFDFRMRALDAPIGQTQVGFVTISLPDTGAVIADLPVTILVSHATLEVTYLARYAAIYDKVFCSYCSADTDIANRTKAAYKELGIVYLRDKVALMTMERWEKALSELIEEANIFQLFWSEHMCTSESVANEWAYALELVRRGKKPMTFIHPVYWVEPMTPPPPELQHLHFAYYPALKP